VRVGARGALLMSLVVLAVASAAPARDTLLRPGVGVGTIRLGMTFAQARAALGKPSRVEREQNYGFGSRYREYAWGVEASWRVGVLGRTVGQSRVVFISTSSRSERTPRGAGVGSTYQTLQKILGARCYRIRSELPGRTYARNYTGCYLGGRGKPVTYFPLDTVCSLPRDRYYICPFNKRRFIAYDVQIADRVAQEIKGIYENR
jgi:hypothetical protein